MRTFSFNRPIMMLFALPMLVLLTMVVWGLTVEFRVGLLVMLIATGGMLLLLIYFSLLRRLKLGGDRAIWVTPMARYEIPLSEMRHYGIVKFRKFRFAYMSRAEVTPFQDPTAPVTGDKDTFIIQYRPRAYAYMQQLVKALHPDLQPESFSRQ